MSIWTGELTLLTSDGDELPSTAKSKTPRSRINAWWIVSTIAHDIGESKVSQQLSEHQATHDPLTGAAEPSLFQELGEQALARARARGTAVAVLFLDLDRFKPVNDSFGHTVGERAARRDRGPAPGVRAVAATWSQGSAATNSSCCASTRRADRR